MVPTFMLCHLSLVLALDYNVSAFSLAMKTIFGVFKHDFTVLPLL